MSKSMYWAGDRGFKTCLRWHDDETIRHLNETFGWHVYYPFDDSIPFEQDKASGFFGKSGSLRLKCLTGIEKSDVVVAYLGSWDTGTAQEIEYAKMKGIPVLGWSDSALVTGEYSGRDAVVTQDNIEDMHVNILPINGMTAVMDSFLEFSKLGDSVSPEKLASLIHPEAEKLLRGK